MSARQNQVLLNALHKRWPRTGTKFRFVRHTVYSKYDLLRVRNLLAQDGWFIEACDRFGVAGIKPL